MQSLNTKKGQKKSTIDITTIIIIVLILFFAYLWFKNKGYLP